MTVIFRDQEKEDILFSRISTNSCLLCVCVCVQSTRSLPFLVSVLMIVSDDSAQCSLQNNDGFFSVCVLWFSLFCLMKQLLCRLPFFVPIILFFSLPLFSPFFIACSLSPDNFYIVYILEKHKQKS